MKTRKTLSTVLGVLSLSLLTSIIVGCEQNKEAESNAAVQEMPPPTVNVKTVSFQSVPLFSEFSGRTSAFEQSNVRPQVTGVIDEILYREGYPVKKDQPLYRISVENYKSSQEANLAAIEQAKANVNTAKAQYNSMLANQASASAQLEQAQDDLQRLEPLISMRAISEQQFKQAQTAYRTAQAAYMNAQAATEQAKANISSAEAAVTSAEAQLSASQLDLSRTIVRAPIAGMSGRSNVTAGALVNANQPEPLVTINKIDPMYVDISMSSSDLLRLKQQQSSGKVQPGSRNVQLILEDGSIYPMKGQLSLAEAKVDEQTGAVVWRATFPNPNYLLLPGMYVKARVMQGVLSNAVLLPQSALIRTPKGDTQIYIVDENDLLQVRDVTVEGTFEGDWIITDGLQAGERVVVVGGDGLQPQQEVNVQPVPKAGNATTSTNANNSIRAPQNSNASNDSAQQ